MNEFLCHRRNEKVIYKGAKGIPKQVTKVIDIWENSHLPYKIELKWEDGTVHTQYVEASMVEYARDA